MSNTLVWCRCGNPKAHEKTKACSKPVVKADSVPCILCRFPDGAHELFCANNPKNVRKVSKRQRKNLPRATYGT